MVGGLKKLVDWLHHVNRKCIAIINKKNNKKIL